MNRLLALIFVAVVAQLCSARHSDFLHKHFGKSANAAKIWAVLVAGSNGWDNYRHQADICHAYHILITHGVLPENIITLAYDDIAGNSQNPYPGKIFNEPYGEDVYAGCKLDYTRRDVTPTNFLNVLQGNKAGISGGNGRVVESTSADNIFVYFADHGSSGFISFPSTILTASQLNRAFEAMNNKKSFNKLVFYLEACESGSMFSGILKTTTNVYAVSAANETESSWGCYCDNDMYLPCLGDLFSVKWLEDSDAKDLTTESINRQFEIVKEATTESEVKHYGDLSIGTQMVAAFQGWTKTKSLPKVSHPISAWRSRDIELMRLKKQVSKAGKFSVKRKLQSEIDAAQMKRQYLNNFMTDFVESLVKDPVKQHKILNTRVSEIQHLQCHEDIVTAFHKSCFNFNTNPYAMEYGYILTNLCEQKIPAIAILGKMHEMCSHILVSNIH